MRANYERGLYEVEEYQYWQKVSALKEKLDLLSKSFPVERILPHPVKTGISQLLTGYNTELCGVARRGRILGVGSTRVLFMPKGPAILLTRSAS